MPWWMTLPFLSMFFAFLALPVFSNKFGIIKLFRLGEHDWISAGAVIFVQVVLIAFVAKMLLKAYSVSGTYFVEEDNLVVKRLFGLKKYPLSSLRMISDEKAPNELFGFCEQYDLNGKRIRIDPRYMQAAS